MASNSSFSLNSTKSASHHTVHPSTSLLTANLTDSNLNKKNAIEMWSREKKLIKISHYTACQVNIR